MKAHRGYPLYFDAKEIGQSLRRVAVDTLRTRGQQVQSWLYQNHQGVDFLLWTDDQGHIIKQRFSLFGQVVEWNVVEGIKTGITIEFGRDDAVSARGEDLKAQVYGKKGQCIYDDKLHRAAVQQSLEVLENCKVLPENLRGEIVNHFNEAQRPPKKHTIDDLRLVEDFKELVPKLGFLSHIKRLFQRVFRSK